MARLLEKKNAIARRRFSSRDPRHAQVSVGCPRFQDQGSDFSRLSRFFVSRAAGPSTRGFEERQI